MNLASRMRSSSSVSCHCLQVSTSALCGHSWQQQSMLPSPYCDTNLLARAPQELMRDPVQAADGFTYERGSIEAWLRRAGGGTLSPMTGAPLDHPRLAPNLVVRSAIDILRRRQLLG